MEGKSRNYFHPVDYAILSLSLVISVLVGIYQAYSSRNRRTTKEYHLGGRRFGILPVALSLIASFISSIALIGLPAEVYFHGPQIMVSMFGLFFATTMSSYLFVPLFYPLGITSALEYLELRFKTRTVRLVGTSICLLSQLLYSGCVVYGQAAALEATTGLPSWASIILVNVLGAIYTAFGGMKAVIWTDVFQISIMFVAMVMVIVIGLIKIGGFGNMWEANHEWGRIYLETDLGIYKRLSMWSMLLSGPLGWVNSFGVSQTAVQRYCAVGSVAKAQRTMVINAFGKFTFALICATAGMVAFAYYVQIGCDPYADGQIPNKNQILPMFVMEVFSYPGLPGIFLSGLFCGSLSTLSSCIASMCAVTWEDMLKPSLGHRLSPSQQVTVNQVITFIYGMAGLGVTYMVHNIGGSLMQISKSFFGICTGPYLGMFVIGALFPWANWIGVLSGAFSSLVILLWIFGGQIVLKSMSKPLPTPTSGCYLNSTASNMSMTSTAGFVTDYFQMENSTFIPPVHRSFLDDWVYSISFMWYAAIGLAICIVVGVVTSFLTGATDPDTVEKRLLFTFMRKYYGKDTKENNKEKEDDKSAIPLMEKKQAV